MLQVTGSGIAAPVKPVVTATSPKTGPAASGTTVTITGHNFVGVTKITAGGVRLTSVHCTSTRCTGRARHGLPSAHERWGHERARHSRPLHLHRLISRNTVTARMLGIRAVTAARSTGSGMS